MRRLLSASRRAVAGPKRLLAITALLLLASAAVGVGVKVHRCRAACDAVTSRGGRVLFEGPKWLRSIAGEGPLPWLDVVRAVDLNWKSVTDEDLGSLALHLREFPHLDSLSLAGTEITDAGMPALSELNQPLRCLDLSATRVGDAGIKSLRRLGTIEDLDLSGTGVTDAGLEHLLDLTRLERLNLDNTAVTDRGIVLLERLSRLEQLDVSNTGVTETGRSELAETLPAMEVFDD